MASSKKISCQMADKQKGYTHVTFYCKTKSRSKVTEEVAESETPPPSPHPLFLRYSKKPNSNRAYHFIIHY